MVTETLSTAVGLVGLVLSLVVGGYHWSVMPRRRHRVFVVFRDDRAASVEGILWARRGPWVVLKHCDAVERHHRTPHDGDVVIHTSQLLFLQAIVAGPPPTVPASPSAGRPRTSSLSGGARP